MEKVMAIVRPTRALCRDTCGRLHCGSGRVGGASEAAVIMDGVDWEKGRGLTRAESSAGDRSAIERRCRSA